MTSRLFIVISVVLSMLAASPALADAALRQESAGCASPKLFQSYPIARMPNYVGLRGTGSKLPVDDGSLRLKSVVTHDSREDGRIARQCPSAGTLVNNFPGEGVADVTFWVYAYEPYLSSFSAHAIVTDSPTSTSAVSSLRSSQGGYYLRIAYKVPCDSLHEVLTASVSTHSSNTYLNDDDSGFLAEWDTHGPSIDGPKLACGTGVVTTDDFDPTGWEGSGTVIFTIGAMINAGAPTGETVTLFTVTVPFIDDADG